ncbi:DUF3159 domain-containing protein [Nocardioides agariphilus]|jgi:hypothetical protein|uniref:DUF3159 domain-containing protein n=1 Tax=Nocardioides agariphilus TaxID=433664 RepID=A0A930VSV6_9ACTN|nr:DUF3159 domain-containing protein [Nocardioides agariphilus]MBF4770331.1 DUF3159 domain-containing protein [Nocardioides agariphilus]
MAGSQQEVGPPADPADPVETVEAVVRRQLGAALGGRRGMVEAAVPTLLFTLTWLTQRQLTLALMVSVGAALVLLAVRLVQRSTPQFVLNALFGIAIGWVFVRIAASRGGDADAQALAYFLPGILYNAGYSVIFALTCLVGWPVVGFMVGSVTGDPTAWHEDKQVVRLCTQLTWLLALPCVLRVAVQAPIYLAGTSGGIDADAAVAALGVLKIALGWPLQLAALGTMVWLLGRNHTPLTPAQESG